MLGNASMAMGQIQRESSVEFGFDSFVQRFRITDSVLGDSEDLGDLFDTTSSRDTTEVFTEYRLLGEFGLQGRGESQRWQAKARASYGSELVRQAFDFDWRMRDPAHDQWLDLFLNVDAKQFRSDSDFVLSSDSVQSVGRAHWRQQLTENFAFALKGRLGIERFELRSAYEDDSNRLDGSAHWIFEHGWDLLAELSAGLGHKDVPDSAAISYDRRVLAADLSWRLAEDWRWRSHASFERRLYADEAVRSPFSNFLIEEELDFEIDDALTTRLIASVEWLDYDEDSSVYFDATLGRVGWSLERQFSNWVIGIEPRWSWLAAPSGVEDRYTQPSAIIKVDNFGGGRFWLSLSEELGRRNYDESATDELNFYSDYLFARTTVLASVKASQRFSVELFLSDEPESHRNDADDGRLSLFSCSLRAKI
jgi:hypothetical protein